MKQRLVRKIVKKHSHKWWKPLDEFIINGKIDSDMKTSYLCPPPKWNTTQILKEFNRKYFNNLTCWNKYIYRITGITF
uniref:Uncharacterized protein n=1 Tax=viral metagenome TaxID=1070528 RepID=A0A6M3KUH7_9ZZZZ